MNQAMNEIKTGTSAPASAEPEAQEAAAPAVVSYALNRTRGVFLATDLGVANHFWTRLRGLLSTKRQAFSFGHGLWIEPSKGVHSLGMRYAIDAVYLDHEHRVIHIQAGLKPWRLGAVRRYAAGVLELPAGAVALTRTEVGDDVTICAEPAVAH